MYQIINNTESKTEIEFIEKSGCRSPWMLTVLLLLFDGNWHCKNQHSMIKTVSAQCEISDLICIWKLTDRTEAKIKSLTFNSNIDRRSMLTQIESYSKAQDQYRTAFFSLISH